MDNEYQRLLDEAKEYAKLRYDMLRLEILEKTTKIICTIIVAVIGAAFGLAALTYFSFAIIFSTKDVLGGAQWGFCIFGCLFVLLIVIMGVFHKQLILNPLIKQLSGILFAPDEEDDDVKSDNCKQN